VDAAFQRGVYGTDMGACSGAARGNHTDPRSAHRRRRLSVVGLEQAGDFTNYHRVLNRNRWSGRWVARCLFRVLVNALVPTGPVVMGLDDTIERRWGAKIKARGIYRDPVRSSHGHFVQASGLRWLSIMLHKMALKSPTSRSIA
jgi:hypothetical protein